MKSLLYGCIIIAIVFGVFFKVVSFSYLHYDDTINVFENNRVISPSVDTVIFFWKNPFLNLYIPVVYTAWSGVSWLSRHLFNNRLDPGLFHLCNLFFHVVNSILVYWLIKQLVTIKTRSNNLYESPCTGLAFHSLLWAEQDVKRSASGSYSDIKFAAFTGAVIFGIHPVQVEAVSWITGFKDVLSCFFVLSAICLYFLVISNNRINMVAGRGFPEEAVPEYCLGKTVHILLYTVSFVFFLFSLLSKPSSVSAPLTVFFLLLWIDKRIAVKAFWHLLPWLFAGLGVVAITRAVQPVSHLNIDYPLLARPLVAMDALQFYISKIVCPDVLVLDYCRTPAAVLSHLWSDPFWLLFPCLLLVNCFGKNKKSRLLLFVAFIASLLPVTGVIPFSHQQISTVADRYLYFAMVPAAVMVSSAYMNTKILKQETKPMRNKPVGVCRINKKKSAPLVWICLIVLSILCVKSFYQCQLWKNTGSIMQHTLNYYPQSYTANVNYGVSLISREEFSKASGYFKKASKLQPEKALAYYNLGLAYAGMGKNNLYEKQYKILIRIDTLKADRLKIAAEKLLNLKQAWIFSGSI